MSISLTVKSRQKITHVNIRTMTLWPDSEGYIKTPNGYLQNSGKPTEYAILPCGEYVPTEYWTAEKIKTEHFDKCDACKVLSGVKTATVLNANDDVIKLFEHGKIGFKAFSVDSFETVTNVPVKVLRMHNRDILAVRLLDGTLIGNSQLTSYRAGYMFKYYPRVKTDISLPLGTIIFRILNGATDRLGFMKVLARQEEIYDDDKHEHVQSEAIVFAFDEPEDHHGLDKVRVYLYSFDEGKPFLCELPKEAGDLYKKLQKTPMTDRVIVPSISVQDAFDMLKPELVKKAIAMEAVINRHGDIFLIETAFNDKEVRQDERKIIAVHDSSHDKSLPLDSNGDQTYSIANGVANDRVSVKHEVRQYERFKVLDSNHTVTYRAAIANPTYKNDKIAVPLSNSKTLLVNRLQPAVLVKGMMRHTRVPVQHKPIKLAKWHVAIRNTAKTSYNVDPRSPEVFD